MNSQPNSAKNSTMEYKSFKYSTRQSSPKIQAPAIINQNIEYSPEVGLMNLKVNREDQSDDQGSLYNAQVLQ